MLCSSGKKLAVGSLGFFFFFSDPSSYVVDQNIIQKYPLPTPIMDRVGTS